MFPINPNPLSAKASTPSTRHIIMVDEPNDPNELTTKINGQRVTGVRDINVQYSGAAKIGELNIKLAIDPTKVHQSNFTVDFTTYNFVPSGNPEFIRKVQDMSDIVHNLSKSIQRNIRSGEVKIASDFTDSVDASKIESVLWEFITASIHEKVLTEKISNGLENLYMIDIIQALMPLRKKYNDLLVAELEKFKA